MEFTNINRSPLAPAAARQATDITENLRSALALFDELVTQPATRSPCQAVTEKDVRLLLEMRRNRDRFFEAELFADPAWDILLELFAANLGQQRVSVTSLCIGASVPSTTALRWIKLLESKGLISRQGDPMDGRRFFVSLTCEGLGRMEKYFRANWIKTSPI